MGFYEVYSHPVLVRYKASVCSRASVFVLVVYVLTYIPPLLITYRSQGKELTDHRGVETCRGTRREMKIFTENVFKFWLKISESMIQLSELFFILF